MNTIHRLQQQQQQSSSNSSGDESSKLFYNPKQDLLLKRHVLQQIHQDHQYDKMNHQIVHKEEDDKELDQQHYAHTYECLDHIEMPANAKSRAIHLGVSGRTSSRNYRHNPAVTAAHTVDLINSFNSSSVEQANNLTDIANFNVSSSSTSSSSGVSSTHQFIHSNNSKKQQQHPLNFLLNSTIGNQSSGNKFMQTQNSQQNNTNNNKKLIRILLKVTIQ